MKRDLLLSFALCLSLTATAQTTAQRLIAKMGIEPKAKVEAPAFIWHDFCPEGKQALKNMLKKAPVSTTVIKETPREPIQATGHTTSIPATAYHPESMS